MQSNGKSGLRGQSNSTQQSTMSDSIWSSLRTSLHLSDLSHLSRFIDSRWVYNYHNNINMSFKYHILLKPITPITEIGT